MDVTEGSKPAIHAGRVSLWLAKEYYSTCFQCEPQYALAGTYVCTYPDVYAHMKPRECFRLVSTYTYVCTGS